MNCRTFAAIVGDLARSELMEAFVQEEARAHVAECVRCEDRLGDERELAKGLRALALADGEKVSSIVDEGSLRAAFRESFGAAPVSYVQDANEPVVLASRSLRSRGVWWGLAVAASMTVLAGGALLSRSPEVTPVHTVSRVLPTPSPGREVGNGNSETRRQQGGEVGEVARFSRERKGRAAGLRTGRVGRVVDSSYVDVSVGEFQLVGADHEETTDFFPMAQGAEGGPMTRGQLVRVVMPRSAMSYFGLPLNVDRADERVKADVLLGEDGLARAIRFVR
ncbi:MAG: hypothetical protein ABI882_15900 [Acidobacteriota bacterium]